MTTFFCPMFPVNHVFELRQEQCGLSFIQEKPLGGMFVLFPIGACGVHEDEEPVRRQDLLEPAQEIALQVVEDEHHIPWARR